jgi:phosphoribosylformylglycinamidine cyclo-ligase
MVDYKASGVDIDAGNEAVKRIRGLARGTFTTNVLSDIGAFGGLFRPDIAGMREPVLVSSVDGVGTKLKVAFLAGRHDTVGIDLVNHCVNDIIVQGAEPLFFLDYLATGRLVPDMVTMVVEGIAIACRENGCALLGGETAEMPGFYDDGEYDLAGFIVGVVDRKQLLDGRTIKRGDCLVGLPSSGLHTNGYSLARRIIFDELKLDVDSHLDELGHTVGDALLSPHRSYSRLVRPLLDDRMLKGLAHVTGGGMTENIPRVLPTGTSVIIDRNTWAVPPLFGWLQKSGAIADDEMFRTFNMGIGLIAIVDHTKVDSVLERLADQGEKEAVVIGEIVSGDQLVTYRT